jgi:hypothetical protein
VFQETIEPGTALGYNSVNSNLARHGALMGREDPNQLKFPSTLDGLLQERVMSEFHLRREAIDNHVANLPITHEVQQFSGI